MRALVALLLLASAQAQHHTYRGGVSENYAGQPYPSCGAVQRLLADEYRVVIDGDRTTVNLTPWVVIDQPEPDYYQLEHRASPDALTHMTLEIMPSHHDAVLILVGADAERHTCVDQVRLHESP